MSQTYKRNISLGSINKDFFKFAPNPIAALLAVYLDDGQPSRPDEQISQSPATSRRGPGGLLVLWRRASTRALSERIRNRP